MNLMPFWYSSLWRFIAIASVPLFGLSQVHAKEFSLGRPQILLSSQQQATLRANDIVFLNTGSTLGLGTELSTALSSKPEVDLEVQGIIGDVAREHASQELQALLGSEEKRLEDELASLDVFPVMSFGLSYRF